MNFIDTYAVNCSNGSIRLTNGGRDNEGRIEICTDNIWMTTDANYWNYNNAKVVCSQLGFFDTCKNILTCNIQCVYLCIGSVAITDINWSGKNERVGYRYTCTGNENNLEKCSKQSPSIYASQWLNFKRGGVDCQRNKKQGEVE